MKVSTPSQFNADIQPIAAAGSIQEHIMQLFQPASSAEHFLQRQVDSVIRDFLNRPETNSKRSLQTLMEIQIATNDQRQIDLNALQAAIEQCRVRQQLIIAIVGIAGTTDAGGVDPLFDLAQLTHAHNIHFHVDAAWGGAEIGRAHV